MNGAKRIRCREKKTPDGPVNMLSLFPPSSKPRFLLRPYQRAAVNAVKASLHQNPILTLPTGAGKTVSASTIVKECNRPTLWLAHRKELVEQAAKQLADLGLHVGIIKAGVECDRTAPVQVASVQTLARREMPDAGLIVVDECFPAGTLVDGRPIESIQVGDTVTAWDENFGQFYKRKVIRTLRRAAPAHLVQIVAGAFSVTCTLNHPIATPLGWRIAAMIKKGDSLYVVPEMRCESAPDVEALPRVLPGFDEGEEQAGCAGTDAKTQPNDGPVMPSASQPDAEGDEPSAADKRWQREAVASSAADACRCAGVADRACRCGGDGPRERVPNALQDRHREPGTEACHRSGRQLAHAICETGSGPAEGSFPSVARVDCVEVVECHGAGEASTLCQGGVVHNLEVEGFPTYTANGIVVHNCHHATADGYRNVIDAYNCPVVGLTATPFRLDGRGLGDVGFGTIIVGATTRQLVEAGTLHSPKVWCSTTPDLRGLKVLAGDYSLGQLAARVNTDGQNADIVETWKKHCRNVPPADEPEECKWCGRCCIAGNRCVACGGKQQRGKRTVAFAVNVEHSQAIVAAFTAAGIAAEHLDGSTPADVRAGILRRLRTGETTIVSNCMVLTEGWDLPALECAIIARPTASLNLHLQMIGRVMRAADGKDGAVVLDHAGNHHVHGLVTRELKYSLDGTVKVGSEEPLGIRRCQKCGLMYDVALPSCPECGHTPDPVECEAGKVHGSGELGEFDDTKFEYRKQIWELIEAEREASGFRPGWSVFRFDERFGVKPCFVDVGERRELVDPKEATMDQKRQVYEGFVALGERMGWKPGAAAHRYRDVFGVWPRGFVGETRRAGLKEKWAGMMTKG